VTTITSMAVNLRLAKVSLRGMRRPATICRHADGGAPPHAHQQHRFLFSASNLGACPPARTYPFNACSRDPSCLPPLLGCGCMGSSVAHTRGCAREKQVVLANMDRRSREQREGGAGAVWRRRGAKRRANTAWIGEDGGSTPSQAGVCRAEREGRREDWKDWLAPRDPVWE
jgi:hypothetical protein